MRIRRDSSGDLWCTAQMVHSAFISGAVFQPFGGIGRRLYLLGEGGLYIARFTIAGFDIPPDRFIPGLYYIIAGAFLSSTLILWRISRSPFGTALGSSPLSWS